MPTDDSPVLRVDSPTVRLSQGCFETMRLDPPRRVASLDAHLDRLRYGARVCGLPVPDVPAVPEPVEVPHVWRLIVTPEHGLTSHLEPLDTTENDRSLSICCSERWRCDSRSPLRHFKSFAYLPKYLANREARQAGYDDAVLTNERDEICELSFSNLFVLPRGTDTWLTPPLDSGCLPGITRAALLASGLMSVREACLSEKDLRTCRAAIATNSLRGIMAISRIEGIELDVSVACRLLEELRALG